MQIGNLKSKLHTIYFVNQQTMVTDVRLKLI